MNAGFRVCRAPRVEPPVDRLLRIYRSEPIRRLAALERALVAERATGQPEAVAFCDYRLPLVRQVLQEKAAGNEAPTA